MYFTVNLPNVHLSDGYCFTVIFALIIVTLIIVTVIVIGWFPGFIFADSGDSNDDCSDVTTIHHGVPMGLSLD